MLRRAFHRLLGTSAFERSLDRNRLSFFVFKRLYSNESTKSESPNPSNTSELESIKEALAKSKIASETPKLLIGFTCKCCQTRTHRTMSRHAYQNGIVLIECPGCQTRHLIADNLGWFKDTPQAARRIDEMTETVGEIRRSLNLSDAEAASLIEFLDAGKQENTE